MAEEPHALVLNGVFVETRMVDPADVPQHKLDQDGGKMLRPLTAIAEPEHEPTLEHATVALIVTPEEVYQEWTVTRRPLEQQIEAVRAECGRRIYTAFPQWRQANYTARATELIEKKADGLVLDAQELAELAALKSVWDWIKAVRAASNVLEALDPIPPNYQADENWPAAWGT